MDFDPTATPSNLPRIANAILDIILDSQGNYKFLYITSDEKESNGEEIGEESEEAEVLVNARYRTPPRSPKRNTNQSRINTATGSTLTLSASQTGGADAISSLILRYPNYVPIQYIAILLAQVEGDVAEAIQEVITLTGEPAMLGLKREQWEKPHPTIQCNSANVRPSTNKECWLCGNSVNIGHAGKSMNGRRMSVCNSNENKFECEHVLPGIFMFFLKMMKNNAFDDAQANAARDAGLYATSCHMCNGIKSNKLYMKARWVSPQERAGLIAAAAAAPAAAAPAAAAPAAAAAAAAPAGAVIGNGAAGAAEYAIAFTEGDRFNNLVRAYIETQPEDMPAVDVNNIDPTLVTNLIDSYEIRSLPLVISQPAAAAAAAAAAPAAVPAVQYIDKKSRLLTNAARLASLKAANIPLMVQRDKAWKWISNRFKHIYDRMQHVCNYLNSQDNIGDFAELLTSKPLLNYALAVRLGALQKVKLNSRSRPSAELNAIGQLSQIAEATAAVATRRLRGAAAPPRIRVLYFEPYNEKIMVDILSFIIALRVGETVEISHVEENDDLPPIPGLPTTFANLENEVRNNKGDAHGVMGATPAETKFMKNGFYINKLSNDIIEGHAPFGKEPLPDTNPNWPTSPDGDYPICSSRPAVHFYSIAKKDNEVVVERSVFTSIASVATPLDQERVGRLQDCLREDNSNSNNSTYIPSGSNSNNSNSTYIPSGNSSGNSTAVQPSDNSTGGTNIISPPPNIKRRRINEAVAAPGDTVAKPINLNAIRQDLEAKRSTLERQLGMSSAAANKLGGGVYRQHKTRRASRRRLTRKKYARKAPKTRKQRSKNTRRK